MARVCQHTAGSVGVEPRARTAVPSDDCGPYCFISPLRTVCVATERHFSARSRRSNGARELLGPSLTAGLALDPRRPVRDVGGPARPILHSEADVFDTFVVSVLDPVSVEVVLRFPLKASSSSRSLTRSRRSTRIRNAPRCQSRSVARCAGLPRRSSHPAYR